MLGKVLTLISGDVKTCFLLALWRNVEFGCIFTLVGSEFGCISLEYGAEMIRVTYQ